MLLLVIILLVLAVCGSFPAWPHANGWGYGPFGGLGFVLLVLVVVLLFRGRL